MDFYSDHCFYYNTHFCWAKIYINIAINKTRAKKKKNNRFF